MIRKLTSGHRDQKLEVSMKSFAEKHPELVCEWSDENELRPDEVSYGSGKMIIWNGKCGHTWTANVKNRGNGHGCPYCSGNKILTGFNDLKTVMPKLSKEWSEKNEIKPTEVTGRSDLKVWWKCRKCSYEWQARIADRTVGSACPVCAGHVTARGINDLETLYPEITADWSDKNETMPYQMSAKSREFVWWKCGRCGFEYQAVIDSRVKGLKCPECRKRFLAKEAERKRLSYDFKRKAVAYYSRLADRDVLINGDEPVGLPMETYFPKQKAVIEVEDGSKHRGRYPKRERIKNWLCYNAGVRLFRIVYPGGKEMNTCACITLSDNSADVFSSALRTIFDILDLEADIDVKRDYDLILASEL